jgi:chloramphenicol O-acetyltransferase type A
MAVYLNTDTWARREAFAYFRHFEQPCFNVCVRVDAAPLKAAVAARGQSFSLACVFLALRLANLHEAFRYRLEGERVRVHDEVHGSSTVLRDDESFGFGYLDHHTDWALFHARGRAALQAARTRTHMAEPREASDDLLYFTTLPWLHFTSFAHARTTGREVGIPKIAFGRALAEGARLWLPVSVEVHHALMDGLHVGRYVQALEGAMAAPEAWLGGHAAVPAARLG